MGDLGIGQATCGKYKGMFYFYLKTDEAMFVFTDAGWQPYGGNNLFPLGTSGFKTEERAREEFDKLTDDCEKEMGVHFRTEKKIRIDMPFICMTCQNDSHFDGQLPCKRCVYHPSNKEKRNDAIDHYKEKEKKADK